MSMLTTLRGLVMTLIQKPVNILVAQTTAGLTTETNDTAGVDSDASSRKVVVLGHCTPSFFDGVQGYLRTL